MLISERPGVYSSVEVSSSLYGRESGRTVGIAAVASKGEKGLCSLVTSTGQANELYGTLSPLTRLIKVLMSNGASSIWAVPAEVYEANSNGTYDMASNEDYKAAFSELMKREDISLMICDSRASQVHNHMRLAIENAGEEAKYRIGIVEAVSSVSELTQRAGDLNSERLVMLCCPLTAEDVLAGELSAAFAGMLACGGDPALPVNGAELLGLSEVFDSFEDGEINALVRAGVSPVEGHGGKNLVVRGLTTRTMTGGAPDSTWRELTTILIIDDVIPSLRSALRTRFPRVKNTAQTRGAIRTQVLIELERKKKQEIIDDYGTVSVKPLEGERSICEVSFEFTVAHGLNRINLAANISV